VRRAWSLGTRLKASTLVSARSGTADPYPSSPVRTPKESGRAGDRTILRMRMISFDDGEPPTPRRATQFLYVTTDQLGCRTVSVVTVFRPLDTVASAANRIFSYQTSDDALGALKQQGRAGVVAAASVTCSSGSTAAIRGGPAVRLEQSPLTRTQCYGLPTRPQMSGGISRWSTATRPGRLCSSLTARVTIRCPPGVPVMFAA
jgi:hypothetical protein